MHTPTPYVRARVRAYVCVRACMHARVCVLAHLVGAKHTHAHFPNLYPATLYAHPQAGINGSVQVVEGNSGSPKVVLKHNCGASAEVCVAPCV